MLSRFIAKSSNLRFLTLFSSHYPPRTLKPPIPIPFCFPDKIPRFYSTNGGDKDSHRLWNLASEADDSADSLFGDELPRAPAGPPEAAQKWDPESLDDSGGGGGEDVFGEVKTEEWATAEGYKQWTFGGEEDGELDLFKGVELPEEDELEEVRLKNAAALAEEEEKKKKLEIEEKILTGIIKGPNRAFGDLIAASGITDEMLDTLLALKDFDGIPGLPPLQELEDDRYEKNTRKSTRGEIERQKQEEVAKARVQQIDDKGRAYGTGRRKCSIARVWVQPGEGKFVVNDKEFDVYFPMLDHRAVLLRPFSETKTLGKWDVNCTVKGGGVSGQVGAIRLGISRALQNWAPDLRPPLRAAGFLTRDSRVVERKKPGKAKARKSFQWVKR